MAKGDTKTNQYLDIAANGTRADLPTDTCCETRSQTLIREVAERIMDVEDEVERLENNPDVVDIVPTYAALQNYDTSSLTDKDIIRVLQDETHDGASTYYRWSTQTQAFTYIGEVGDYYTEDEVDALLALKADKATTYTKTETDALLDGKQDVLTAGENITIVDESGSLVISAEGGGGITELTAADYNYPTDNPTQIAAWLLPDGIYHSASTAIQWSAYGDSASNGTFIKTTNSSNMAFVFFYRDNGLNEVILSQAISAAHYTNLSTSAVKQSTGTSTTDVMSQNATTSMVFADPSTKSQVRIGNNAVTSGAGATSIGGATRGAGNYSVAIGNTTRTTGANSVALGSGADASQKGQFDISTSFGGSTLGYNDTQYRLLTGLYDGQSAHDAATKGQLDSIAIRGAGAPTTSTVGTVGQLYEDGTNGALYQLKSIDITVTPNTYNWEEVGAGGGGGPTVVQTIGTSTTDVMSQNAVTSAIYVPGHDPVTSPTTSAVALGYYNTIGPTSKGSFTVGTYSGALRPTNTYNERSINILGGDCIGNGSIIIGVGARNIAGDSWNTVVGASASTGGHSMNNACFGYNASTAGSINGASAIGAFSSATRTGEMNIGSTDVNYGYNSSNYRLLTGLYDGQSAHDAATVGQITPLTGSAAPTTDMVGTLGKIYIDTSTATAYMCVAADTATPSYTWKQITA